jgi:hypothetical protein
MGEHLAHVRDTGSWRSVSAEIELEPGQYEVVPKIEATRNETWPPIEDVVKQFASSNPTKLRQIGLNYETAHAKGNIMETRTEQIDVKPAQDSQGLGTLGETAQMPNGSVENDAEATNPAKLKSLAAQTNGIYTNGDLANDIEKTGEMKELNGCVDGMKEDIPAPSTNVPTVATQKPNCDAKNTAVEESATVWNAAVVIGLRVYSKEQHIKVSLMRS